jgi:hypothetical protein
MSIHFYGHLKKQSWILVSTAYQIFTFFVPHNKHNFQTKSTATYHTLKVSLQENSYSLTKIEVETRQVLYSCSILCAKFGKL